MNVDPSKIRDIIGKGGATVKGIAERTGASIDTNDDGEVKIFAKNKKSLDAAVAEVEVITAVPEVGNTYDGKVVKVLDFGAFVNILPGKDGLLAFADLETQGVNPMTITEGKEVKVIVQSIERQGKVKLALVK